MRKKNKINDKLVLVYGSGGATIDPANLEDFQLLLDVLMDSRYVHARIDRNERIIEMYTQSEFDAVVARLQPVSPAEVGGAVTHLQEMRADLIASSHGGSRCAE